MLVAALLFGVSVTLNSFFLLLIRIGAKPTPAPAKRLRRSCSRRLRAKPQLEVVHASFLFFPRQ